MRYASAPLPQILVLLCTATLINSRAQSIMQFEVASIKLNKSGTTTMKFPVPSAGRFQATNFPLKALIAFAYGGEQIYGAPDWTNSERFDVDARAADIHAIRNQYQQMLQSLLVERFKLQIRRETRELPTYELLVANAGSRLKAADPKACDSPGKSNDQNSDQNAGNRTGVTCGSFYTGQASLDGRSMSMAQFCNALAIILGRPVTDHTGVEGRFDIHLEFDPEGVNLGQGASALTTDGDKSDDTRPSIFSALQQQLGLKLQSHKEPAEVLIIDRLERIPTEN